MGNSLQQVLDHIQPLDENAMQSARRRQDELTKPRGSLGRLEELAIRIAGIRGYVMPSLENKAIVVMAADHGRRRRGRQHLPAGSDLPDGE